MSLVCRISLRIEDWVFSWAEMLVLFAIRCHSLGRCLRRLMMTEPLLLVILQGLMGASLTWWSICPALLREVGLKDADFSVKRGSMKTYRSEGPELI